MVRDRRHSMPRSMRLQRVGHGWAAEQQLSFQGMKCNLSLSSGFSSSQGIWARFKDSGLYVQFSILGSSVKASQA